MIARIWTGFVREADRDVYYDYLKKTGLEEYGSIPGNRGIQVLRRVRDGKCEFTLITLWDSYDAIRAFAGDDFEKAKYYDQDKNYLLELDPHVKHYEVLNG
jgi:heme-degrading monooxygenase HmoA